MSISAEAATLLQVENSTLDGVKILRPRCYEDSRGSFFESWQKARFEQCGLLADFVQDNVVHSRRSVLRGLHYQMPRAQLKLVSTVFGEIFDVVVDIRRGSPTYGKWFGLALSAANRAQLWIEPGFAHGYQVLSDRAVVQYKCTHVYEPADEKTISWADPDLAIRWPLPDPILSEKDRLAPRLGEMPPERVFSYTT